MQPRLEITGLEVYDLSPYSEPARIFQPVDDENALALTVDPLLAESLTRPGDYLVDGEVRVLYHEAHAYRGLGPAQALLTDTLARHAFDTDEVWDTVFLAHLHVADLVIEVARRQVENQEYKALPIAPHFDRTDLENRWLVLQPTSAWYTDRGPGQARLELEGYHYPEDLLGDGKTENFTWFDLATGQGHAVRHTFLPDMETEPSEPFDSAAQEVRPPSPM